MDFDFIYKAIDDGFSGVFSIWAAYLLCLAILVLIGKKREKLIFVYPFVLLLFTLYNPILITPIMDKIGLAVRIRRIYWLLPVNILVAYICVRLVLKFRSKLLQVVSVVLLVCIVALSGQCMLNSNMEKTQNIYKINNEVIEVANALKAKNEEEVQTAFVSPNLLQLREYDPSIFNTMTRSVMMKWSLDLTDEEAVGKVIDGENDRKKIALVLRFGYLNMNCSVFRESLKETKTEYLILEKNSDIAAYLTQAGCILTYESQNYYIFDTLVSDGVTVFLTRHGQTKGNKKGLFMGGTLDSPLTKEACTASEEVGKHLAESGIMFDGAYSSELDRAYHTAENILKGMDQKLDVQKVSGCNDIYWGEIEGWKRKKVEATYGSSDLEYFLGTYEDEDFINPAGGENYYTFYNRFDEAMNQLGTDSSNQGKTLLLVAHSSAANWAETKFQQELDGLYHNSMSVLQYVNGDWILISWDNMYWE